MFPTKRRRFSVWIRSHDWWSFPAWRGLSSWRSQWVYLQVRRSRTSKAICTLDEHGLTFGFLSSSLWKMLYVFLLRHFPGHVLHHSSGILQAAARRERLLDGFLWHRPDGTVNTAGVQLTHVRYLGSYRYNPKFCSDHSGGRDRSDDCEVLRELAAASVGRGFCFGGTGPGTHTHVHVQKLDVPL